MSEHDPQVCERFHRAIELIGRRWSGSVLYVLLQRDVLRFCEIREAIPDISDRLLTERLKELEDAALVVRTVTNARPVLVTYGLTGTGRELGPILDALAEWASRWDETPSLRDGAAAAVPPTRP